MRAAGLPGRVVGGVVGAAGLLAAASFLVWGAPGQSPDPAATDPDDTEPATARGLAAAVDAHLASATLVHATDSSDGVNDHQGPELRVDLTYRIDGRQVEFSVGATEDLDEWEGVKEVCAEATGRDSCALARTAEGRPQAVLRIAPEDGEPGFALVAVHRGEQIVFVTEQPPGQVRLTRLPVSVESLGRVVTDPLVGLTTSRAMNDAGRDLPFGV